MSSGARHHHFEADLRRGALHVMVHFDLIAPWTLLFGPSGSGKTTILRAIAGFYPKASVDFARYTPQGSTEFQARHHWTPSRVRHLAYAPQVPSLFPHLTVRENVEFGIGCAPSAVNPHQRDLYETLVAQAIDLFRLGSMLERRPAELSGGEQQRVNLARAFAVPGAKLMLLDEPFSGVDRKMRDALLPKMVEWVRERGIPVVSVSHDVEEALLVEAEVVMLEQGRVTAQGPAVEVLWEERGRMLAVLGGNVAQRETLG